MLVQLSTIGLYSSILPLILLSTNGTIQNILLYLHALGMTMVVYFLFHQDSAIKEQANNNEMYGLRHLIFNVNIPPKTLWFNMGYWDKEKDLTFPEACENLVHAVVSKFNMKPNSNILDVGFGCGDSCIVLAEQYKAKVTGITNESSQWRIANDRVSALKQDITLLQGSADDLDELLASDSLFDYILSIDSAYHYNTRWSFLKSAYHHLQPTGKIGLYDLAIDADFKNTATTMQKQMIRIVCGALHIPLNNLVTAEEYKNNLIDLGYKNVHLQQLERDLVFGGLSKSFETQYKNALKYGIGTSIANAIFLKVSSYLFQLLATKPWIVPVLVEASK